MILSILHCHRPIAIAKAAAGPAVPHLRIPPSPGPIRWPSPCLRVPEAPSPELSGRSGPFNHRATLALIDVRHAIRRFILPIPERATTT